MNTLDALLTGIATDPHENTGWLVLADYLAEAGRYREETFLRLHRRLLGGETAVRSEVVNLLLDGVVPIVPSRTLVLPGGVELKGNLVPGVGFVGVTQVTQVQWKAVMGTEPSHFKGPNRPVETVSWVDCNEFCTKLNEFLGDGTIVRLPTEAEWELACRAGTTTLFWSGDTEADLKKIGWYFSNSHRQTQDVGLLCPNPWGLYDVHGNVWEWCENEYNPNPEGSFSRQRTLRGGSWINHAHSCRGAYRCYVAPGGARYFVGFRVRW